MKGFVEYSPPDVQVGDVVLWYDDKDQPKPTAALVTEVYPRVLSLAVLVPGAQQFMASMEVYHRHDPHAADPERARNGCWELAPQRIDLITAFAETSAAMTEQRNRICMLEARLAKIEHPEAMGHGEPGMDTDTIEDSKREIPSETERPRGRRK